MLRRVRDMKAALAFGSTVAVCLAFGTVCSVDRAGLSSVDASAGGSTGGTVSAAGGGRAIGSGGTLGGSGNSGTGGASSGSGGASSGSGGSGSSGGSTLAGGSGGGSGGVGDGSGGTGVGSGGSAGLGGGTGAGGDVSGTGGDSGSGGIVGSGGAGGAGGNGLTGGAAGGANPTGGAGGLAGTTGGAGGTTGGSGGTLGSGGRFGSGGAGGGHPPSCDSFPSGSTFNPPTDNLLHCYWLHADAVAWETAEATCESEGGTLATILSSQENMAVLGFGLRVMLFAGGTTVAWLGATDGKQENDKSGPGKYAWVTGEPWGYTNWHSSQPDGSCACQNNNNMCACDHWLALSNDGTWYDRDDSTPRPYICEAVAR